MNNNIIIFILFIVLKRNNSTFPPEAIFYNITVVDVRAGETATLQCIPDFHGEITVWWQNPKEDILSENWDIRTPDSRVSVNRINEIGRYLEISNIERSDEGIYNCIVTVKPTYVHPFQLNVLYAPVFVNKSPSIIAFEVGQNVTLFCKADAKPTPTIFWTKIFEDGNKLVNFFTGTSLMLSNVRMEDACTYECRAENGIKPFSFHNIILDVLFGPIINIPHYEVHQDLNETTWISCLVRANPEANITWFKDGKLLETSKNRSKILEKKTIGFDHRYECIYYLIVLSVDKMDYGRYICHAVNQYDSTEKSVLLKDVSEDLNTNIYINYLSYIDDSITLNCSYASPYWHFLQRYRKQVKKITHSTGRYVIDKNTLKIKSSEFTDAGVYTCIDKNNITEPMELTVIAPLKCLGPIRKIVSGDTVSLSCSLALLGAHMDWEIEWSNKGIPLASSLHYNRMQINRVLQFAALNGDDHNNFVCSATNSKLNFSSECNYTLIVQVSNADIQCDVEVASSSSSVVLYLSAAFAILIIIFIIILGCVVISYEKKSNSFYRSKNNSFVNPETAVEMKPLN